jgi:hypothetical protein
MGMLIHYILSEIPVLLEGAIGTSKTRTTLIACEYITKIINMSQNMMVHYNIIIWSQRLCLLV